ncbi:MAG TPA: hypothetical protein VK752_11410 [Bryobacteraceae bacterium]|jgi:hypothetical protein|nr:hypothetical protein [Bryobacteraceae bacterium]
MPSNEMITGEYACLVNHFPPGGACQPEPISELTTSAHCRVTIASGHKAYLHSDPAAASLIRPVILRTQSLDEFKSWMSVPDEVHRTHPAEMEWEIPSKPWNGRLIQKQDLDSEERTALDLAYYAYVFGDSRRVESYREILENCFAPFEAAVYKASRVRIEAHGDLIVQGCAAILEFDDLIINAGGRLILNTPCNAAIGRLVKHPAPARSWN